MYSSANVVQTADINYLRTTITDHFSDTRENVVNPAYKKKAKEFIFNEFQRFGLATEYNSFTKSDDPLVSVSN